MVHINSATPPKGRRFTFPGIKNSWMLMADGKWEYVQRKPGRGQIQIKPNTSEPSDWYVRWKGFYKTKKDFQGVVEQGETEEQRKKIKGKMNFASLDINPTVLLDYNRLEFRSIIVPMIKQATNQSMIEVFDVKQWKYRDRYLIGREVNRFLDFPFKFIKDGRVMKLRIGKERIGQLRIKNMRHWEVAHCISEHVSQATDATSMFYIKELLIGTHKKNNKVQMKLGLAEYDLINGLELSESDLLTSICKLNTKQKAQTLVRHPMLDIRLNQMKYLPSSGDLERICGIQIAKRIWIVIRITN
eukprot:706373_1